MPQNTSPTNSQKILTKPKITKTEIPSKFKNQKNQEDILEKSLENTQIKIQITKPIKKAKKQNQLVKNKITQSKPQKKFLKIIANQTDKSTDKTQEKTVIKTKTEPKIELKIEPKSESNTKSEAENSPKLSKEIKKPPFLFAQTQAELVKLSELLDCPVLSYFKPPSGVIWGQDLYAILECLKTIGKQKKLALYIRSSGGQGMVSLRIINLLRSFADKLILLAPLECASAATMLALGCDEIFMGPLSSLSPVDSSLTHSLSPVDSLNNKVPISLDELWRVLRLWQESDQKSQQFTPNSVEKSSNLLTKNIEQNSDKKAKSKIPVLDKIEIEKSLENPYKYLYQYVHPLVFGAVDRHSSLSLQICKEIMSYHLTDEKLIDQINHKLNYDYPAHGYPITAREAKKLGLNILPIETKMQDILNNLQLLYSEMTEEKITDYDNTSFHDNSIYSITETVGVQVTYQQNYDKFCRESEKRYITINDQSCWFKTIKLEDKNDQKTTKTISKNNKSETKVQNPESQSLQNSKTEQIFF